MLISADTACINQILTPCAIQYADIPLNAASRCRDGIDKETERQDSLSLHSTYTHIHSRLGGKKDEMEREAKRVLALLFDYPPLPMPAAVFPARRG